MTIIPNSDFGVSSSPMRLYNKDESASVSYYIEAYINNSGTSATSWSTAGNNRIILGTQHTGASSIQFKDFQVTLT
jgi:hypothetical protein